MEHVADQEDEGRELARDTLEFTDVYTWGQLDSTGHTIERAVNGAVCEPTVLRIFEMRRVIQVVSSNSSSLALTADGQVWGWGPGIMKTEAPAEAVADAAEDESDWVDPWGVTHVRAYYPQRVEPLLGHRITRIAAVTPGGGTFGFAAISTEGELFTWGSVSRCVRIPDAGLFDADILIPLLQLGRTGPRWVPTRVVFPEEGAVVKAVALGDGSGIALTESGDVYTWTSKRPALVTHLQGLPIRQVEAGGEAWFAVVTGTFFPTHSEADPQDTEQNDLYTWGVYGWYSNGSYLGHGIRQSEDNPRLVEALQGQVLFVKAGFIHCGAVTVSGDVYTWGDCDSNRLGHVPCLNNINLPKRNETLSGRHIVQLSHARGNEAALTGFGGQFKHEIPTRWDLWALGGNEIVSVSTGRTHTALLTTRKATLKEICVRFLSNHLQDLPEGIELVLPREVREYMGQYLHDRGLLDPTSRDKLGLK